MNKILAVDPAWTPDRWLTRDEVLRCYARELVMLSIGETRFTFRGGINAETGKQSVIEVGSVVVLDTRGRMVDYNWVPPFSRELLFARDQYICAYCGETFKERDLTVEHIIPASRGGPLTYTNCASACKSCNTRKRNRTPEEASMKLLYLPYTPNRFEKLLLENRNILADQMELLRAKMPKQGRFHS